MNCPHFIFQTNVANQGVCLKVDGLQATHFPCPLKPLYVCVQLSSEGTDGYKIRQDKSCYETRIALELL